MSLRVYLQVKKELESLMDRVHDDGRVTLVRSLVFSVQPRHVDHKGKLRLRCRGQIGVTYQLNSEEIRVRARTNSSRLHVIRGMTQRICIFALVLTINTPRSVLEGRTGELHLDFKHSLKSCLALLLKRMYNLLCILWLKL